MTTHKLYYLYLTILFLCSICGFISYKHFDLKSKILYCSILLSLLAELAREVLVILFNIKAPVYHFLCFLDITLITIYYIKTIKLKHEFFFISISIITPLALEILNTWFFQPMKSLNSNMFILESFVVIIFSLHSLYCILLDDNVKNPIINPDFWFWSFLLFMWSGTFFFWAYIKLIYTNAKEYVDLMQYIQISINAFVYFGIGTIFYYYPKMIKYAD